MRLDNLNAKQRQVAQELDKNILLLAAAGTGKTNTLAWRVVNILESKRAKPEEIVCLTFTNKACNEMKQRIVSLAGSEGNKVLVKTFHGFCYEVLHQEAKKRTDIFTDFTVFDEEDCRELIRSLAWCAKGYENGFQSLIGLIKERRGEFNIFSEDSRKDYEHVLMKLKESHQKRINAAAKNNYDLIMDFEAHCGEIISEYDNLLAENHGVDFCDLINGAYQLLQEPEVQKAWQERFRYWCVDEVQDTSRLEYRVLERLFGDSHLLFCGDFFQTIYEWRGSEPKYILECYRQKYDPVVTIFDENFRSTEILLGAGTGFLKSQFPADFQRLFSEDARAVSQQQGELIVHRQCSSIRTEAMWIYQQLQNLQPENLSKVCILVRSNSYSKKLSAHLGNIQQQRNGKGDFPLSFMLVEEFKFFRRQEIKDVVAALRLLINPQDSASLLRLLKRFGNRIGPKTLERIQSEEYRQAGIRVTDFLHPSVCKYGETYEMLLRGLEEVNVVVFDVEATGLDTAKDEIIQIAAIKLDIHGREQGRLMHYLRAGIPVGASEQVHHISDAKLAAEGMAPAEALEDFCAFARGSVIVGHNVVFDLTILASQLERLGLPPLEMQGFYDTLDIYRRFYPRLPNHKLEFLGEYFHVQHKSSHDAFDDICATGEILIYAVKNNILPVRDERRRLMQEFAIRFQPLAKVMNQLRQQMETVSLEELVKMTINRLGMDKHYAKEQNRIENMWALVYYAREYGGEEISPYDALQEFLRMTSLSNTELELMLAEHPRIPIITVHQAKGSEFDTVFMAGLQEGEFPAWNAVRDKQFGEEARLFYVAMTRARQRLYITSVPDDRHPVCRFIKDIPADCIIEDRR